MLATIKSVLSSDFNTHANNWRETIQIHYILDSNHDRLSHVVVNSRHNVCKIVVLL